MKILHTADLHLGAEFSFLGQKRDERRFEVAGVFGRICQLCRDEGVEICLIAGDLFDSNSAAPDFADSFFSAVRQTEGTCFFYVSGNHDPLDASSVMRRDDLPENLWVLGREWETVTLRDKGVRIKGVSFSHSSMLLKSTEKMPDDGILNLMLLHADFGGKGNYAPITAEFVQNCGADYLALGHIHKRTAVEQVGNTFVSYCGCPEGQGFDETGVKGVYLGEVTKNTCKMKFVPTSKRLFLVKKADISFAQTAEQATETILSGLKGEIGEGFENHFYKILLTGSCEADFSREISAALGEKLHFVKVISRLSPKVDLDELKSETTLRGVFVRKMLERLDGADISERQTLLDALTLGLRAFEGEVEPCEDLLG